jgi:hypothetical protein
MDRDNEVVDAASGDLPNGEVSFARAATARAQEDRHQRVDRAYEGVLDAAVPLAVCTSGSLQLHEHLRRRVRRADGYSRVGCLRLRRLMLSHQSSVISQVSRSSPRAATANPAV